MKKNNPSSRKPLSVLSLLALLVALPVLSACGAWRAAADKAPNTQSIQKPTASAEAEQMLKATLPNYTPWTSCEINGKLSMAGLPISPSVKIFMAQGSDIVISLRAPFVGEVGRITVAGDSITAVNKFNHVYCRESVASFLYDYPTLLTDAQSLILGRVAVVTEGELSPSTVNSLAVTVPENISDKKWLLSYPKPNYESDYKYSYMVNSRGEVEKVDVNLDSKGMKIAMECDNSPKGRDLNVTLFKNGVQKLAANMQLDAPTWNATAPAPLKINSSYRQLPLAQFLKSFKL